MNALKKLLDTELEAREFGFEWPDIETILKQTESECEEIREAIADYESRQRLQEEIGDLIHTTLSLCVFAGFDVDETLENVTHKFSNRMTQIKQLTHAANLPHLKGQTFEFMLELWQKMKNLESSK